FPTFETQQQGRRSGCWELFTKWSPMCRVRINSGGGNLRKPKGGDVQLSGTGA
ncbi:unnamed protein product, partial [Ectocarpus sp. 12 AP-2014]